MKLDMQCHRFLLSDFDGPLKKEEQAIRHGGALKERDLTTFCIDVAQTGVGGIDSWGSSPLPQHCIKVGENFNWAFRLRPFGAEEGSAVDLASKIGFEEVS